MKIIEFLAIHDVDGDEVCAHSYAITEEFDSKWGANEIDSKVCALHFDIVGVVESDDGGEH